MRQCFSVLSSCLRLAESGWKGQKILENWGNRYGQEVDDKPGDYGEKLKNILGYWAIFVYNRYKCAGA